MTAAQFWYDLKTHSVVTDDNTTKVVDRLGPYATYAEAEHALERVEERNQAWDEEEDDD